MNFRINEVRVPVLTPTGKPMCDNVRVLMLLPAKDNPSAEDIAMLQALYSRDPQPIDSAVKLAKTSKSGEFMAKYYVGYSHDSIADCGNVLICVEGCSLVTAKLIQHHQLYNGQEASTRYLDFSSTGMVDPTGQFPNAFIPGLKEFIQTTHKRLTEEYTAQGYGAGASAAAFDVVRGWLPLGTRTNLSWWSTLRNVKHHMQWMAQRARYLPDAQAVLTGIQTLMRDEFSSTWGNLNTNEPTHSVPIHNIRSSGRKHPLTVTATRQQPFDWSAPSTYIRVDGHLDYGSWRDLQRHRGVVQEFNTPSTKDEHRGFRHPWYINTLGALLGLDYARESARVADRMWDTALKDAGMLYTLDARLYHLPLMQNVNFTFHGEHSKVDYITRLRTKSTVHPTLRRLAAEIAQVYNNQYSML